MAAELGFVVYTISLHKGLDDAQVSKLSATVPVGSIVLLEDIDTAGIERSNDLNETENKRNSRISLSGLLNAIDGLNSSYGYILIMSTNNPENLDEALVRPGRVDLKVSFSNCTSEQAEEMFTFMFSSTKGKEPDKELLGLAKDFAGTTSGRSPAEIQNFLTQHKNDPQGAVAKAPSWFEGLNNHEK